MRQYRWLGVRAEEAGKYSVVMHSAIRDHGLHVLQYRDWLPTIDNNGQMQDGWSEWQEVPVEYLS